ncbi:MAG: hypothetical protein LBP33_04985 [Candidatus Adiutrix sp.]|jgi:hypothetical protein|nr:hypothetical protein [Candidatus Adiutrix sp.]
MSSNPIAKEIVDWWLALTGRKPGDEQGDLNVPPPSQTDDEPGDETKGETEGEPKDETGKKEFAGGRITFDGDYSWLYIKAFTIKIGQWLADINLGLSVTLKLAADFFAKGVEASVFLGGQMVADFAKVKSWVFIEALTLENLEAAVEETEVHLSKIDISAGRVEAGVEALRAQVENIEATAEKMAVMVNEMQSAVDAQEALISEARAAGQRTRAGVNRSRVTGAASSLSADSQSIDGAAVSSSGSVVDAAVDEDQADGVNSEASPLETNVNAHSEIG